MRQLASIQRIKLIEPIIDADFIETATIIGWKCVVKKGEFKEGELIVFFEPDSLLPVTDWSLFLCEQTPPERPRIKIRKYRKQYSQGLVLPISILAGRTLDYRLLGEGEDVTLNLGVDKYEVPESGSQEAKGNFPGFLRKTDEERIQNVPEYLEQFADELFYTTYKLNGSSFTAYKYEGEFGVCSRNLNLRETEGNKFWAIARSLDLENKLPEGFAIQGELIGPGVQGDYHNVKTYKLYVFNAFNILTGEYLDIDDTEKLVEPMGLKVVPIYLIKPLKQFGTTVEEILNVVNIPDFLNPARPAEGLVFRPVKARNDLNGSRLSFKGINTRFLLKYE